MRASTGVAIIGAILAIVSGIEILTHGPLAAIDTRVAVSFAPVTASTTSDIARILNSLGKPDLACLIVGSLGLVKAVLHRAFAPLLAVATALVLVGFSTWMLKEIFPHTSIVDHRAGSFPSGHTGVAVVAAGLVLWLLLPARPWRQAVVFGGAALWGGVMAWGRLVSEAHWLSDVIAGWGIGMVALVVALRTVDSPLGRRGWAPPAPVDR